MRGSDADANNRILDAWRAGYFRRERGCTPAREYSAFQIFVQLQKIRADRRSATGSGRSVGVWRRRLGRGAGLDAGGIESPIRGACDVCRFPRPKGQAGLRCRADSVVLVSAMLGGSKALVIWRRGPLISWLWSCRLLRCRLPREERLGGCERVVPAVHKAPPEGAGFCRAEAARRLRETGADRRAGRVG